jgi:hypothetical protein
MRTVLAALLASAAFSANADFGTAHQVDLDTPGALERVQRDHPAHFRAITEILREAPYKRPQALSGWVRTAFDAKMASAMLIKTSYPPQTRLQFVLDDTEYRALVTLRNVEPAVMPAEQR